MLCLILVLVLRFTGRGVDLLDFRFVGLGLIFGFGPDFWVCCGFEDSDFGLCVCCLVR